MRLKEKLITISNEVRQLDRNNLDVKLPQNTYYLNEHEIVCFEREKGETRYPFDYDGLVVWATASGSIEALESTFHILSSVSFFTGIPNGEKEFFPISVTNLNRQLYEPISVLRYVVYSNRSAYYIAETNELLSAVRLHTDARKHIHFSYVTLNKSKESYKLYMADYFEPGQGYTGMLKRFGEYEEGSYLITKEEHGFVLNSKLSGAKITDEYHTTGEKRFLGASGRQMMNAVCLRTGKIAEQVPKTTTNDNAICADLFRCNLEAGEFVRIDYDISYYHNRQDAEQNFKLKIDTKQIDFELDMQEKEAQDVLCNLNLEFGDWEQNVNVHVLNRFLKNVQKQVSLCALGKNYVGALNGIRDIMQQIESCLMWQPEECKKKFVIALNYILEDGRPPRQFSLPETKDTIPKMDLRKFIDQGNWIISTLYTYLAYTNDYSILNETCGYYIAVDNASNLVAKSDISDTVLDHVIKIMDYLVSNLDTGGTECLKALFGDWNDALNGLGRTSDKDKEFGTGVSVMASLHFYQNCREICKILSVVGGYEEKISKYTECQNKIKDGLFQYAVDVNEKGEKQIVHGWGDKLSYKIGTWRDPDGVARTSSTVNSFWALSGMIRLDTSYKEVLMSAFDRLDSKYGFLTFDKVFPVAMSDYVGRIVHLAPGTYENAASYVHSGMFAIMALFALGESKRAWKEMEKAMVISHENCTRTPFVMPNSYCYNEEYSIDGDSMNDWYTGSGTVLIKSIVKYGFGIAPDLDGLKVQTAAYMPCNSACAEIMIKGHKVKLEYTNHFGENRKIYVNGNWIQTEYDSLLQTYTTYIPNENICDDMMIEIID